MTGEAKWQTGFKSPNWAGTLVTAGGLVFTGTLTGEFIAVDADNGNIVWRFRTPRDHRPAGDLGTQRRAIRDGHERRRLYPRAAADPNLVHVPRGGSLWTFKLFEN